MRAAPDDAGCGALAAADAGTARVPAESGIAAAALLTADGADGIDAAGTDGADAAAAG